MELTEAVKDHLRRTAEALAGSDRRLFLARTVRLLGPDGQRRAERELGWNRVTIRKGTQELDRGVCFADAFSQRGRLRAEEHLPGLLTDLRALVESQSQTDPSFQSQRLFTRLSVKEVRRQLIGSKGYRDEDLPSDETLRRKMHDLGFRLRKVQKCKPKKRYRRPMPSSTG
jgi:hypothetical protein